MILVKEYIDILLLCTDSIIILLVIGFILDLLLRTEGVPILAEYMKIQNTEYRIQLPFINTAIYIV